MWLWMPDAGKHKTDWGLLGIRCHGIQRESRLGGEEIASRADKAPNTHTGEPVPLLQEHLLVCSV